MDGGLPLPDEIKRRDYLDGAATGVTGLAIAAATPSLTPTRGRGHNDSFVRQILKIDGLPNPDDIHSARGGRGVRYGRISPRIEHYDCVIVGGGASGLATAKFYRDRFGQDSRILILEAMPDFGGHAARNEFHVPDIPGADGQPTRDLMTYVGVDPAAFPESVDNAIPASYGLRDVLLFDRSDFGTDHVVANRDPVTEPDTEAGWRAFLGRTPYDSASVEAVTRIQTSTADHLSAVHGVMTRPQKVDLLRRLTYRQYLLDYVGATEQSLLQYQRSSHVLLGAGIQAVSAADMWLLAAPGFAGLGLGDAPDVSLPGVRRSPRPNVRSTVGEGPFWPDGNASLLRLLVAKLIPGAVLDVTGAPPDAETIVTAQPDQAALDRPGNSVRIRLNSLVVKVRPAVRAGGLADVLYVPTGSDSARTTAHLVRATHVVMACWNRVTAQIVEGLPRRQVKGLTHARQVPLIYGRAVLTNWRAFAAAGIGSIAPRGNSVSWDRVALSAGARFGSRRGPDNPAVLNFSVVPTDMARTTHPAAYERDRESRPGHSSAELEADLIDLIDRTVNARGGDFDPGRDLSAIMINRWKYGYAHELTSAWDPTTYGPDTEHPHVKGRLPFRNIAIANSDSGAFAYTHSAFSEGYRAVHDLPVPTGSAPRATAEVVAAAH